MSQLDFDIILKEEFYWAIKEEIPYNDESENFADYLQKEKEKYDISRSKTTKILVILLSLVIQFINLVALLATFSLIINLLLGTSTTEGIIPGIPSEVSNVIQIAVQIAVILGLTFVNITFIYVFFFTQKKWSPFHNRTLALFQRLEEKDLLKNYIVFQRDERRFRLTKLSIDWEFEWIFPFIFDGFPPLLYEILLISFLLPFSLSTFLGIVSAIIESDFLWLIFTSVLGFTIICGFYSAFRSIFPKIRIHYSIRQSMIFKQQEKIHSLILQKADDLTILRNQNNLSRLLARHPFPLPSLFRISAIIPLLGSVIGYLIGALYI